MVQSIDQKGEYVAPAQQAINVAFQGERGAFGDLPEPWATIISGE